MPVYVFRCPACGPFELQRTMQQAAQAAPCPTCAGSAMRSYAVGRGGVLPGPFRTAAQADRARVYRARSGEPMITAGPTGRRLRRPGASLTELSRRL